MTPVSSVFLKIGIGVGKIKIVHPCYAAAMSLSANLPVHLLYVSSGMFAILVPLR